MVTQVDGVVTQTVQGTQQALRPEVPAGAVLSEALPSAPADSPSPAQRPTGRPTAPRPQPV